MFFHKTKNRIIEFSRAGIKYRVNGREYVADIVVGSRLDGSAIVYDIVNISQIKKVVNASPSVDFQTEAKGNTFTTNNSISNPAENVNKKFSDRDAEYLGLAKNPEKNEAK